MTRSKPTDAGPKTPDPDPIDKAEGEEGSLPFKPKDEEEGPDEAAASGAAKKAGKKGKEKTAEPEPMPGLIEGRMVHYCLPDGKRRGEHRAATISYVHDHGSGLVNLHVLLNGAMDYAPHSHPGNNMLVEKVPFSQVPQTEGHWHWMEKV